MKIKGADYVMFKVSDLEKSVAFYRDVLGLKPYGEVGESWAEFDLGNVTLDLFSSDFSAKSVGEASIGLAVDDVEKTVEELRKKGVKIIDEVYDTPVCNGATIADPDGNKITIHRRKDGTYGSD